MFSGWGKSEERKPVDIELDFSSEIPPREVNGRMVKSNQVLVKVEGQLIRTGVFEGQTFAESPAFTLNLTLVRNPDMAANKRYPLGVWKYDFSLN